MAPSNALVIGAEALNGGEGAEVAPENWTGS